MYEIDKYDQPEKRKRKKKNYLFEKPKKKVNNI